MATLSGVPLCSRGVDLLIYGISAAVSLQAAAQLRYPDRLIPALPPQRLKSPDGPIVEGQSTPLDASRPPAQILDIVRDTLQSYGLPEAKVKTVLVGGTGFKSAGSVATVSGARIGIPVASLEAIGVDVIRRSPLQLKAIDGWDSALGRELYASLRPSLDEVRWTIAHECAHIKHEDGIARGLGMGLGLVAYHGTTKLLWRRLGAAMHRGSSAPGVRAALVCAGPVLVGLAQVQLARQQEYAADRTAAELSMQHALVCLCCHCCLSIRRHQHSIGGLGGIAHLERTCRYHSFRRDCMGDGTIDSSGDIKTRWMTHPPTESRLEELRSVVADLQSVDRTASRVAS